MRNLAHRFELPAFWSWWTGELARALPGASRAAVQRRRMRPILAFAPGAAVLWVPRVASGKLELVEQAQVPLGGDPAAVAQAGHAAIEGLARKAYGGSVAATKLRVALPPSQVLRKTLVLPAAVEENLRQAIEWDLDRHTPFPAEQLHFDAVVVGRDAQNKTIRVDWAAALRSHVDQAVRQAQAWGATVVAVTPEMPGKNGAVDFPLSRLNLLPAEARTDAAPWRRWQLWLPLGLVLVAVAAAVAVPIWQKRERFIATAKETAEARAQAAAADALRAEFEKMTGDYNFALARKFGFPPAVQLIEDLSRLLPDDTWLLQFELKTPSRGKEPVREVVLRGESGSASRLVALLEESKLFEQASPRSPMTKIQPGPGEIFDLGAQLKPLPPPAMIELVALAPPEGAAPAAGTPAAAVASGRDAPARPGHGSVCDAARRRRAPGAAGEAGGSPGHARGRRGRDDPGRSHGRGPSAGHAGGGPGAAPRTFARRPAPVRATPAAPPARRSRRGGVGRHGRRAGARDSAARAAQPEQPAATGGCCAVVAWRSSQRAIARVAAAPRRSGIMTAALARLSAPRQRALALALLLLAVAAVLAVVLLPVVLLHRHYDDALESLSQRLATYRRVAAQAPEYRKALATMKERDARRFYLRNTAPNLAAAELQEQVRAAIEGNGGRISTSQNQSPRDDGRFKQIVVSVQFFATTPNLQKILNAIETQQPYLTVDNLTLRPLNAFRGFRPAPGQEPEINVQLDVSAFAFAEPAKKGGVAP